VAQSAFFGLTASLIAGAMTGIGGLIAGRGGVPDDRRQNLLIGFAAGVMIAAAVFSLIVPAVVRAQAGGGSAGGAIIGVTLAVAVGALAIGQLGGLLERLAASGFALPRDPEHRRAVLIILAITLHNLPEGTAVGLSFMSGDPQLGWATMFGIGIQNIPEGMAVAAVLMAMGWSPQHSGFAALATGLVELVGGALGVGIVALSQAALPWALGFAAGAMLFAALAAMLPHVRRRIEHGSATPAVMVGLALMMVLDLSLG
jgi:ZIP family zinc transporter